MKEIDNGNKHLIEEVKNDPGWKDNQSNLASLGISLSGTYTYFGTRLKVLEITVSKQLRWKKDAFFLLTYLYQDSCRQTPPWPRCSCPRSPRERSRGCRSWTRRIHRDGSRCTSHRHTRNWYRRMQPEGATTVKATAHQQQRARLLKFIRRESIFIWSVRRMGTWIAREDKGMHKFYAGF